MVILFIKKYNKIIKDLDSELDFLEKETEEVLEKAENVVKATKRVLEKLKTIVLKYGFKTKK